MARVRLEDVNLLNELIERTDDRRSKLTTTLLTIYVAITSGLFFLVVNDTEQQLLVTNTEVLLFSIIFVSAAIIVLLSVLDKLLSYFSVKQVGDHHAERMRKEDYSNEGLTPKEWTAQMIMAIPVVIALLIIINALTTISFVLNRII